MRTAAPRGPPSYGLLRPTAAQLIVARRKEDHLAIIKSRLYDVFRTPVKQQPQLNVVDILYESSTQECLPIVHRRQFQELIGDEWVQLETPKRISSSSLCNDLRNCPPAILASFFYAMRDLREKGIRYYLSRERYRFNLRPGAELDERISSIISKVVVGPVQREVSFYVLVANKLETWFHNRVLCAPSPSATPRMPVAHPFVPPAADYASDMESDADSLMSEDLDDVSFDDGANFYSS